MTELTRTVLAVATSPRALLALAFLLAIAGLGVLVLYSIVESWT